MAGLTGNSVQIYLDDIIVHGETWEKHLENLYAVLKRLEKANLTLQLQKCHFFKKEVAFLGHIISTEGIKPQQNKIQAIKDIKLPDTVLALQSFLGFINYYKKFIRNFSNIAAPLYKLLKGTQVKKKNNTPLGEWTTEQITAFETLKASLSDEVTLKYPDYSKPFFLTTDASQTAIGGVLQQRDDNGDLRPITFFSRVLNSAERNYSVVEREALAIVWGLQTNRCLILGYEINIHTDHRPLVWILEKSHPNSRIARWQILVSEYNITTKYIPGKENVVADFLSRVRMNMIEEDKVLLVTNRVANVTNLPMNDTWNTRVIGSEQDIHPVLGRLKYLLKNNRMNEIEMNERDKIERLYRCKITELQINDNLLCVQRSSPNRVVILLPENRIATALSVGHSSPTAGHGGVRATLDRLNKLCYWPEMNKDVKEYVRECEVCQRFKPATEQAAPLRSYPPAEWPFARVHMDLIGPLNASQDGYKYILTCVDACTRYLVAVALRTKNAEEVVEAFTTNFICQHGVPCWLVTDNGSEFINEKFKGLAEAVGLKHTQVTAYHPSANGLVERANKTIVSILRTLTEDNPHMWSKMLGYATLAYNTATNRTLGETPYFCLYLKDPKLPYDILGKPFSPSYNIDSTKEQVQRMMQACYARCQEKN